MIFSDRDEITTSHPVTHLIFKMFIRRLGCTRVMGDTATLHMWLEMTRSESMHNP